MLTGTMNFNAKHGCQRCNVVGKHSGISNTVVFTKIDNDVRTDELFRANGYPDHQKAPTPLVQLPHVDMIRDFVVADPLHLLELGVMKRLIIGWRSGNMACPKWSQDEVDAISEHLQATSTPSEIHRCARSLSIFRVWKGQEFRNFLNYYGIVVLRDHLGHRHYSNFVKLFCAVRLASSEKYLPSNYDLIEALFKDFVVEFKSLYGPEFMTSNVHNILHIIEDVKRFGILPSISAYVFESCLGKYKSLIRVGKHPLQSVARRLIERCNIFDTHLQYPTTPKPPILVRRGRKHCKIEIPQMNFSLTNYRFADEWFMANGAIFRMIDAEEIDEKIYVEAVQLMSKGSFFTYPFESSLMNIYVADTSLQSDVTIKFMVEKINCKFMCIKEGDRPHHFVFIPILHTEE